MTIPLLQPPGPPRAGGEPLVVHEVFTGQTMARVATLNTGDMEAALDLARATLVAPPLPAFERAARLEKFARLVADHHEELALLIAREGGKPLTDARVEMTRAAGGLRLCAEEATRLGGQQIPMAGSAAALGHVAFTLREPVGVVAAFSAFNHPFNLLVHQAGPALAAGCPVLLKPSPATPLCALRFVALAHEAGFEPGLVQAIPCDNTVAATLAASGRIDYLSFIGATRIGWRLRSALFPGVRCVLELGGAAPVVVNEDADLDLALPLLLKGGFYHAGQVCVSVQRVFAHRAVARPLAQALALGAAALVVGDPQKLETQVGPLISAAEAARVHEWVTEAVSGGAELLSGGQPRPGQCYAPTVLFNPPPQSRVMTQEVFGPVVCVQEVADMAGGIAAANSVDWCFQAAVFTQDVNAALLAARQLRATAVMVNQSTTFRVDWMPFGGKGPSGLGVGGIGPAVRDMTNEKLVVLREG